MRIKPDLASYSNDKQVGMQCAYFELFFGLREEEYYSRFSASKACFKYRSPSGEGDLYCLLVTWILCQVAITRNSLIGHRKAV